MRNPEIATEASFASLKHTILKTKAAELDKQLKYDYSSVNSFFEDLQTQPQVQSSLLSSTSRGLHIVIYDQELIDQFNNYNDLFIDATFKALPKVKGITQMLTIMAKKFDIVRMIVF